MRKWIIRTLKVGLSLLAFALVATIIVAVLASQQPAFYTELRSQPQQSAAAESELQEKTDAFKAWAFRSARIARAAEKSGKSFQDANLPDPFEFEISEEELNGLLASEKFGAGNAQNLSLIHI